MMTISEKLLEILVCPQCKGEVQLTTMKDGLTCRACQLVYPIRDNIPVMLIDEAYPVNDGSGEP